MIVTDTTYIFVKFKNLKTLKLNHSQGKINVLIECWDDQIVVLAQAARLSIAVALPLRASNAPRFHMPAVPPALLTLY